MNEIILTLLFLFSGMVFYRLLMNMCECYEGHCGMCVEDRIKCEDHCSEKCELKNKNYVCTGKVVDKKPFSICDYIPIPFLC